MEWYDFFNWFIESWIKIQPEEEKVLRCDYSKCQGVIEENKITYDKKNGDIYHVGTCAFFAKAPESWKSGEEVLSGIAHISREKALKLLRKGILKQSGKPVQGLEERASD
ncbi:MAG: hypothetical protein AABX79_00630 [Nanoarchaeota archaeon]